MRTMPIKRMHYALLASLALVATSLGCSDGGNGLEPGPSTSLVGVSAPSPTASYVRVDFAARVTKVKKGQQLGNAINVGDDVRGFYVYDEAGADANLAPIGGQYRFDREPFGMQVHIAGLIFRSNPGAVDLTIDLTDEIAFGGAGDLYLATSASNLEVLPGVGVDEIRFRLQDDLGAALSSDVLMGMVPDVADWPTTHDLRIKGPTGWQIEADITSIWRQSSKPAPDRPRFHHQ